MKKQNKPSATDEKLRAVGERSGWSYSRRNDDTYIFARGDERAAFSMRSASAYLSACGISFSPRELGLHEEFSFWTNVVVDNRVVMKPKEEVAEQLLKVFDRATILKKISEDYKRKLENLRKSLIETQENLDAFRTKLTPEEKVAIGLEEPVKKIDPPRLHVGDTVRTTKDAGAKDWGEGATEGRKWGVIGKITTVSDRHGLCYRLEHDDYSYAWYEHAEVSLVRRVNAGT